MTLHIGIVSQKGGVGKSSIARLLAKEYASNGWHVKIADMDRSQSTSYNWLSRRLERGIQPEIAVEQFVRVDQVLRISDSYDLVIFDGTPASDMGTLQVAKASDLVVLPTGPGIDDLEPTVKLAHELKKLKIKKDKIVVVLYRIGDSKSEIEEAQEYVERAGYFVIVSGVQDKTGYRRAIDVGGTLTETNYRSLNDKADQLVQCIVNRIERVKG